MSIVRCFVFFYSTRNGDDDRVHPFQILGLKFILDVLEQYQTAKIEYTLFKNRVRQGIIIVRIVHENCLS